MKAFVITEAGKYGLQDFPDPVIGDDELLIRPRATGICHSDYLLMNGKYIIPIGYPAIPGHEWSGEVVEIGKNVTQFQIGDRVVGECVIGCGQCPVCQGGNFTNCPDADHFGFTINGAFAEYLRARPEWLHRLPDSVPFEHGALIEPFSVSYYAIHANGGTDASETVAVLGCGPIGLSAVAAANAMGARTIAVEPLEYRRDAAARLGASETLDPTGGDLEERIRKLTGGYGADLVLECAGTSTTMPLAMTLARNNGRIGYVGIDVGTMMPAPLGLIQGRGLRIMGTVGSPYVWERVITFLAQSGKDVSPLITHKFPLSKVEDAFALASGPEARSIKVMVVND